MPRRKRSSWGSVSQLSPGRFRIRWHEWVGFSKVRKSKVMRCTRREADAELARLRGIHELPQDGAPCPTFAECWDRWYLPELMSRIDDGTLTKRTFMLYRTQWRCRVLPRWGDTVMRDVKASEYQEWLLTLGGTEARHGNILIGNMVSCAIHHDVRGIDFKTVKYRMPKEERKTSPDDIYTLDEYTQICRELVEADSVCAIPAILMAFGSCRVGEACGALCEDVHELEVGDRRFAVVDLRWQLPEHGMELEKPKTPESIRPVIIWGEFADIILHRLQSGEAFLNDDGTGRPVARQTLSGHWRKAFKTGAVTQRYLPMTKLRNSWQTFMRWGLGIDKDKVDRMMGHSSSDVRSRYYDRPDEVLFAEAVAEGLARWELKAPDRTN